MFFIARLIVGQHCPVLFAGGPVMRIRFKPARIIQRASFDAIQRTRLIADSYAAIRTEGAGLGAATIRLNLKRF